LNGKGLRGRKKKERKKERRISINSMYSARIAKYNDKAISNIFVTSNNLNMIVQVTCKPGFIFFRDFNQALHFNLDQI
jgi:hypothetical protein